MSAESERLDQVLRFVYLFLFGAVALVVYLVAKYLSLSSTIVLVPVLLVLGLGLLRL